MQERHSAKLLFVNVLELGVGLREAVSDEEILGGPCIRVVQKTCPRYATTQYVIAKCTSLCI